MEICESRFRSGQRREGQAEPGTVQVRNKTEGKGEEQEVVRSSGGRSEGDKRRLLYELLADTEP